MVTDSLRYWVQQTHIDGFRFDLGTILAREPNGFDNQSGFLKACSQDPILGTVKLIAEPWDCGPGGYQVGGFPPGWAEWNDTFRDDVRDFWRGQLSNPRLADRLAASAAIFNHQGRRPSACINFVTAHDGFTLNDVVTYNDKHNEANGEENRDGTSDNRSWNCGAEGPVDDGEIVALRQRQIRNMLTTLLVAQGTPMMLGGDEMGRTQQGNNNAYCQDNELSWVDWTLVKSNAQLVEFVRKLCALRHRYRVLRRNLFLNGDRIGKLRVRDVTWLHTGGLEMREEHWADSATHCFGMLLDGRAQTTGIRHRGNEATLLIILNAHHEAVDFTFPKCTGGRGWCRLIDTNLPEEPEGGEFAIGNKYSTEARSMALFVLEGARPPTQPQVPQ
jgi:glycogen operon protein